MFAPGGDVEYALGYIETMQVCEARIRELVDFHLVMVSSHPPTHDNLAYYWKKVQMHPRVCGPFPLNADSSKKASVRNYANKRVGIFIFNYSCNNLQSFTRKFTCNPNEIGHY